VFEMSDQDQSPIVTFPLPDDSHVQTFHLDKANVRGRIVRLGRILNDILEPHAYPDVVEKLLAQTMGLTVLLSSMLKYEGMFILQAQGDGPVTRLVCDMNSAGDIRATASFDAERLKPWIGQTPSLQDLMGKGYLAFTVDQGEHMDRYQGIVELQADSLENCIHHYFSQSEQILTAIRMAVQKDETGKWRCGAIMIQHMPSPAPIPQDVKPTQENWNRSQILLHTCKDEELLDPKLHDDTILYRLFHEEGVRVYPSLALRKGCRCTTEKLMHILTLLSEEDQKDAIVNGKITMTCEFCNKDFAFAPDEITSARNAATTTQEP
jgi:molecular chaperone Hsp33